MRVSGLAQQRTDSSDYVRGQQLNAMLRFTPVMMVANVVNAAVSAHIVSTKAGALAVLVWLSLVVLAAGFAIRSWIDAQRRPGRGAASPRAIRRATWHGAGLGLLWGALPALWFAELTGGGQLLVATLVTGMICCGAFALATVPSAANGYVVCLTAGGLAGVLGADLEHAIPLVVLLLAYSVAVCYAAVGTARLYVDKVTSEAELTERGEVIQLLLSEFQQNASDWLFELDAEQRFQDVSPRLAEIVGLSEDDLLKRPFADWLSAASKRSFAATCEAGVAFKGLLVEVVLDDGTRRWWSISASPIVQRGRRASGWRCVGSDVSDAKTAKDRVIWLATTDALTGLPNRTTFRDAAASALSPTALAVAVLDLDGFKGVNDSLGHAAGDQLLVAVARRLKTFESASIGVGRLGGDEFGLFFESMGQSEVVSTLRAIGSAIAQPFALDAASVVIGTTAGVAFRTDLQENVDRLLNEADTALYAAKHGSKGSVAVFDAAMDQAQQERREFAEDLRRALAANELWLAFQPVVDIATSRVVYFEALLRWTHPTKGLVPPDRFIAVAETTGLIAEIGKWVLKTATRIAATWPDDIGVAVNLSPVQLGDERLDEMVFGALAKSGLDAHRLELELTEAVFIRHGERARSFIEKMNAVGVRIALDDFGTGFSSLGYLTRLPVHKLKIDRSFVSGQTALKERNAVISAVISMARALSMETTAEGIENEAELAWIRGLGCNQGQGYYFAKPLRAEDVQPFLDRRSRRRARKARISEPLAC
ncbi:PAS domain S-box-containing protein/diguanylate cyclase (GGDEF)-like protein [Rhodopseudomonas faecalis]|uniref:PAS domain S-box-containing protein/diguanylate cyclase (GGDEF)-like protein n=2 Tax=Rhodopseudomonas faecalis TaxID=99655 RepID=A0A318TCG3_9BRAD|nr:PAS domain S-box-containing protein/diguanylate cyclase (GGDEF)-like protein [Rhodopseudomonas faecalis]